MKTMRNMLLIPKKPKLRTSRPKDRLEMLQQRLQDDITEKQRERVLARMYAAQKALAKRIDLTDRDIVIARALARFRFMTAQQIISHLTGLSTAEVGTTLRNDKKWAFQHVRRRLQHLFDHRVIDRPQNQNTDDFGSLVYGLGNKGARVLAEHGDDIGAELNWRLKNKKAGGDFIHHTLGTTEAILFFDLASRARDDVALLDHRQLIPLFSAETRRLPDPFALSLVIHHQNQSVRIVTVPDRLFSLCYTDDTRHNFALELDTGSMDIWAKQLVGKATFLRKISVYYNGYRQGLFEKLWNMNRLRVLTVTTGEGRIATMSDMQQSITQGHCNDLFLYATPRRLAEQGPFGPDTWLRADGTTTSIVRA